MKSGSYTVLGADLSLNRPGFAIVVVENGIVKSVETCSVDNKKKSAGKLRGQILTEIAQLLFSLILRVKLGENWILVRESSINNACFGKRSGTAARTGISGVVGVTDYIAWKEEKSWEEIYPVSIKKAVTGNARASKEEVAEALRAYVGQVEFANDDESDAAAVAIAWLLRNHIIESVGEKAA